jgi:hypothetical protein
MVALLPIRLMLNLVKDSVNEFCGKLTLLCRFDAGFKKGLQRLQCCLFLKTVKDSYKDIFLDRLVDRDEDLLAMLVDGGIVLIKIQWNIPDLQ